MSLPGSLGGERPGHAQLLQQLGQAAPMAVEGEDAGHELVQGPPAVQGSQGLEACPKAGGGDSDGQGDPPVLADLEDEPEISRTRC